MHSKAYSRLGVFTWSPIGVEPKGLIVADFAQYFDPTSANVSSSIEFLPIDSIYSSPRLAPSISVPIQYRFNELSWSYSASSAHSLGIVAGGTEDGSVVFLDADSIINKSQANILSAQRVHQGHVLSVAHSQDSRWLLSGGGSGQLLLWDLTSFSTFSPGKPNYPDQIKMVRWNKKADQIAACISSHRCSVYDLRRPGAPIIEFGELGGGCDWNGLSWNPTDASSLILCSQSDALPLVQRWDLRFATAPLKDLRLHQKGVSAVDWA
ncbi:hypothetical protein WR25_08664 [Diploscapter pachys]|uniref:Uncharacterized protein n=1 Tax=Diploscapter pachys TaxID=2018661 RepID=A0A2A2LNT3_9BILA|nr:hypothetical protein WR25_08664 [Diploscapter pachys]